MFKFFQKETKPSPQSENQVEDKKEPTSAATGFSFMQSEPEPESTPASGFGFMSSGSDAADDSSADAVGHNSSSFSFLTSPSAEPVKSSQEAEELSQFKTTKVAKGGVIKKKRSSIAKVGIHRQQSSEDVDEEANAEPTSEDVKEVKLSPETTPVKVSSEVPFNHSSSPVESAAVESAAVVEPLTTPVDESVEVQVVNEEVEVVGETITIGNRRRNSSDHITETSAHSITSLIMGMSNKTENRRPSLGNNSGDYTSIVTANMSQIEVLQCNLAAALNPFIESVYAVCGEHEKVAVARRERQERIEGLSARKTLLSDLLADAESKQSQFALAEEFEKADALTDTIEEYKVDLEKCSRELDVISTSKNEVADTELNVSALNPTVIAKELRLLSIIGEVLEGHKDENKANLEALIRESTVRHARELVKIQSEETRVQMQKDLAEKEEQALDTELNIIETTIKKQTDEEQQEKSTLTMKIVEVCDEIACLERKLAEKKSEEKRLRSALDETESRIASVSKKFERQLTRIADKRESLLKGRSEINLEESELEVDRAAYQRDVDETSKLKDDLSGWIADMSAVCYVSSKLTKTLDYIGAEKVYDIAFSSSSISSSGNESLRNSHRAAEADVAALKKEKLEIESKITANSVEINQIDDKLPKLELEKKAHAAARKFKEAGVSSKEIKDLTARKEEILEESVKLEDSMRSVEEKLVVSSQNLVDLNRQLMSLDKETDMKLLESYKRHYNFLKKEYLVKVLKNKKAEVVDSHTIMKKFAEVAVKLVDTEVLVLRENIIRLCAKHELVFEEECCENEDSDCEVDAVIDDKEAIVQSCAVETSEKIVEVPVVLTGEMPAVVVATPVLEVNVDDTVEVASVTQESDTTEPPTSSAVEPTENEVKVQVFELQTVIEGLQNDIESSTENEEFDRAAELDEQLQGKLEEQRLLLEQLGYNTIDELR